MWLVCICFFGVFLKLRNFDKNHLMPLQWLSVLCIITKSVLSLKFSFCSSYKSSVSWKSTQDRDWSEKRKNWTPNDVLPSVFHTTCSRFLRWSSFDRAHGRLASFEISPRSMFPTFSDPSIRCFQTPNYNDYGTKLYILATLGKQRSSRSAVHLKRPDFSLFDTFLL